MQVAYGMELGKERIWLVLDEPGTGFAMVGAHEHRISTATSLSHEIASGDRVLFVQPRQDEANGSSLPVKVVRVAEVAQVRATNANEYRLTFEADSVVSLLPGIPLGDISPLPEEISVNRPIAEVLVR